MVDSETKTWNMCPETLVKALVDRKIMARSQRHIIPEFISNNSKFAVLDN